ncbi:MAG TPA: hypothetical protein VH518_03620 [Tepidisphaeraceae bacterium]|jgi:hypothetical protein
MNTKSRIGVACIALTTLLCGRIRAEAPQPTTTVSDSSRFLRFVPDAQGGKLQASVVTYRNADGVTVDLIAAIHIADKGFFADLNKSFEQYDALLYEMVKPKDMEFAGAGATSRPAGAARPAGSHAPRNLSWVGTMQRFMRDNLDLTFQLDEIDYSRPNFVHADLDVETFTQMQDERGESMLSLMFQTMLRELANESSKKADAADVQPSAFDLLAALQSTDRSRQLKLILAKQFTQMDDMMAGFDGPDGNGSVLVTERNKAAINVLRQRILKGDKKLGIFYGAAHLKGMEKILLGDLGFQQVGEPKWRTAWDLAAK